MTKESGFADPVSSPVIHYHSPPPSLQLRMGKGVSSFPIHIHGMVHI